MSKTVFVLENGCYSDQHIVGIFSTLESAEIASRIFRDDASISEWPLDGFVKEMRRGCVPWFVRLKRETGDVMACEQQDSSYGVYTADVGEDVNKDIYTHCWAQNSTDAIKIASERRRMHLAKPPSALPEDGR